MVVYNRNNSESLTDTDEPVLDFKMFKSSFNLSTSSSSISIVNNIVKDYKACIPLPQDEEEVGTLGDPA